MTRLLLADDEPLIRHGIGLILSDEPGLEVVGLANDGQQAVALTKALRPDVVLMDIRMPVLDGVEATRQIVEWASSASIKCEVLVLTTYNTDEAVRGALRAGATGFLLKDAEPEELIAGIRAVAEGEAWLDPSIARGLLAEFKGRPASKFPESTQMKRLTPREIEVLILAAHGLSNTEIAGLLVIAETTVKTHLNRILAKLGLHDRSQAVAAAYRSGLVKPDDPLPLRR